MTQWLGKMPKKLLTSLGLSLIKFSDPIKRRKSGKRKKNLTLRTIV